MIEHFSLPSLFNTDAIEHAIVEKQEEYQRVKTLQEIAIKKLSDERILIQNEEKKLKELTDEIVKIEHVVA